MSRTALIAGAGIGGLAAGIALRRAGWQIRIFEQSQVPRAVGFAIGLAPNAMAAAMTTKGGQQTAPISDASQAQ